MDQHCECRVESLLIERPVNHCGHEQASTSMPASVSQLPAARNDNYVTRYSSSSWILIELVITMGQTIAALVGLLLTRNEYLEDPSLIWVIGYTASCFATLPYLYWRYDECRRRGSEHEPAHSIQILRFNNPESSSFVESSLIQAIDVVFDAFSLFEQYIAASRPRVNFLVDAYTVTLEIFNVAWICVGTLWVFDGNSFGSDASNLHWLSIMFLAFSSAKYVVLFMLSLAIYISLISTALIMSSNEAMCDIRGIALTRFSAPRSLVALPTYTFRTMRRTNTSEIYLQTEGDGGILTMGTDKKQTISVEDAFCCICLAEYVDNDEIRELPCMHFFHLRCVDQWLRIKRSCPLCKSQANLLV